MKIRGISNINKIEDVKVEIKHPATKGVVGSIFGNIRNYEKTRKAFFSGHAKDLVGADLYVAFLRAFCTGWDFINDETGEKAVFDVDFLANMCCGLEVDWIAIPFFNAMNDYANFYAKPNKI